MGVFFLKKIISQNGKIIVNKIVDKCLNCLKMLN